MTEPRSIPFKVSKPATPAVEKGITECISKVFRSKRKVKMFAKSLVSEDCDDNEIMDGIKDMVNMGKLHKSFVERTIELPVKETSL